ncbi:Hypothetical predicted protein [Pelobates cultripes]|uniref:Peptidase M12B propeptide domain-containing protein n=1 Tax=Pelobates cultripes TaxID=61616 RepID=A0AAD1W368_PELCU|nr:Hypothetical predicted protein [Pelobates cultripes]
MEGAAGLGGTRIWMGVAVMMLVTPSVLTGRELHSNQIHLKKVWPHSAVIEPRWLLPHAAQSKLKYPPHVELLVTAEGKDLILSVHRNQELINPNYVETYYSLSYRPVVRMPNMTEHCYYQGFVLGEMESSVVISTCLGIKGKRPTWKTPTDLRAHTRAGAFTGHTDYTCPTPLPYLPQARHDTLNQSAGHTKLNAQTLPDILLYFFHTDKRRISLTHKTKTGRRRTCATL